MPSIHKNLVFDHLYFSTNDPEFEEIKKIFLRLNCASHQVVNADDESWEGVYVQTRGQNYLEILKDRRVNGIGLCQKAASVISQDARHIVHDFPDLPWKNFERSLDGQRWFTAKSCDNYLDLNTPFNTWVMHYHQRDSQKIWPLGPVEVLIMIEIHFSANPSLIETIKLNSTWFNSIRSISEQEAIFDMQTLYSDPFRLHISFDLSEPGFRFREAIFKLNDGIQIADMDLKFFSFSKRKDFHVLQSKT